MIIVIILIIIIVVIVVITITIIIIIYNTNSNKNSSNNSGHPVDVRLSRLDPEATDACKMLLLVCLFLLCCVVCLSVSTLK